MMKYLIYTWDLVWALESASPCLLQESSHIYWFHPSKQTEKSKEPRNEILLSINRIVVPWSTNTEPRTKRGTDKINMLKQGRKTAEENKSYRTAWTHIWIPALRETDLEPSAKRGANRNKTLVSLYWSSRSLHRKSLQTKSHSNQPK